MFFATRWLSFGSAPRAGRHLVRAAPVLALCVLVVRLSPAEKGNTRGAPPIDAAALSRMLQSADKVEKQLYPWGRIRWLMNDKLDPGANLTFGLVEVNAGQDNPLHAHPNCEELLYLLSGSCRHRLGNQTVLLKAGDLLRIPAGVPHAAKVLGDEPMKAVVVYSAGEREFVTVEENE